MNRCNSSAGRQNLKKDNSLLLQLGMDIWDHEFMVYEIQCIVAKWIKSCLCGFKFPCIRSTGIQIYPMNSAVEQLYSDHKIDYISLKTDYITNQF